MNKFLKIVNFLLYQWSTISNFFFNIYILFILSFSGYADLVGEGFIVISIVNLFTYGLSFNSRNIYIANKNYISFDEIISFRLLIGFLSILFCYILINFFIGSSNIYFHMALIVLSSFNWIFEMILAKNEKEKKINKYFFLNSIVFFILLPVSIIFISIKALTILILLYSLLNIILFNTYFRKSYNEIISSFNKNIFKFKLGISSTILKYFSNFIWRYSAFLLIGSYKSGVLFLAFSLGSFFGTLFDISYGAFLSKNIKKSNNYFFYTFLIGYLICATLILYLFNSHSYMTANDLHYLNDASIASLIGGIFMVHALKLRQKLFETKINHKSCFKLDMLGYLLIIFWIPSLFYINDNYVIYAYFFSSIFTYVAYKILTNAVIKTYK